MYELFKLNNGLRVVVENIDHVNSVSVGLWVENGSRNEKTYNNGISHFIEHMLFKGTYKRTAKEIAESIEDVGGQLNAFTGKESTCYYIKVLNTHIELALDILSDMLFNSKLSEEEIEKEKGVISEEIKMNDDSPEDVLTDLHNMAVWGDDSISLPILGTYSTIKSFNSKVLRDYINSHYIPENCVLSICGRFNIKDIYELIEKYFGFWGSENKSITNYSKPSIYNKNLFMRKEIEQLHVNLGIPGLPVGDEDIYGLILLCNILGGGASSILFQKIREEMGICYSIYAYSSSLINTGVVTIYSALNSEYIREALDVIEMELDKFSMDHLSEERLYKSKEQLKGSYILGLESTSSRMFSNGRNALFLNKLNTQENVIAKIDSINREILERVINKTFKKGIVNSAFVGKDSKYIKKSLKNLLTIDKYSE